MADTVPASRNFDLGFVTDIPRDQLPRGASYRMRDYVPQLGAPARKRGGTLHASADLNALSPAIYLSGLSWAPFQRDPHLVALSEAGNLYQVKSFSSTSGSFVAATGLSALTHKPIYHRDRLIVLQALNAAAANPKKYYDSGGQVYAVADLGGSPPQARIGFSWGEYLVLGNGYVGGILFPKRLWFSGISNPEAWAPGSSFHDVNVEDELVAAVPLRNIIVVWGYSDTWMITGDSPPTGGNLANRLLFQGNGCMDGRTVALYREYVIWANNEGVWKSDGATLTDLTDQGGISTYWRSLVSTFNFSTGWSAKGGVFAGNYIITVHNSIGVHLTTLVCDIDRQVWTEFRNIEASMFAERTSGPGTAAADGHEELFFAHRGIPRVQSMSSCWTPSSSNASDADGMAVLPEIETEFFTLGTQGQKRIRRAYLTYDMRSAGASPRFDVSMVTSPLGEVYGSALTPTLPFTTKIDRKAVEVRRRALGVAIKIVQVGASADTSLYGIEYEGHPIEGSS